MEKTITPYKIEKLTFKRCEPGAYTYEITFNRSLENSFRMTAMCDVLNRYEETEARVEEAAPVSEDPTPIRELTQTEEIAVRLYEKHGISREQALDLAVKIRSNQINSDWMKIQVK